MQERTKLIREKSTACTLKAVRSTYCSRMWRTRKSPRYTDENIVFENSDIHALIDP